MLLVLRVIMSDLVERIARITEPTTWEQLPSGSRVLGYSPNANKKVLNYVPEKSPTID